MSRCEGLRLFDDKALIMISSTILKIGVTFLFSRVTFHQNCDRSFSRSRRRFLSLPTSLFEIS